MPGIDESLTFYPLRIAVLTVSDTRTEETDKSGALLAERLTAAGHKLAGKAIVMDNVGAIQKQVNAWVADPEIDLIITTGGTGFAPRDVTPEAVKPLLAARWMGSQPSSIAPAKGRSASPPSSPAPLPGRS